MQKFQNCLKIRIDLTKIDAEIQRKLMQKFNEN